MTQERRRAAIDQALRTMSAIALERDITIKDALALVTAVIDDGEEKPIEMTPRASAKAARQAQRKKMIDMLLRLESEGRGPKAVTMVAHKFSHDEKASFRRNSRADGGSHRSKGCRA